MAIDDDVLKELDKLEAGLDIDEHALDEALVHHADCYYRVAKGLALAISYKDAAKQDLAECESRVDLQIRETMKARDEKVTEKELESRRRMSKEIKAATTDHLNFADAVGRYTALKEAFQQRGFALNKLVDLYVSGYFGDATHRSTTGTFKDHQYQKGRAKLAESMVTQKQRTKLRQGV